MQTRPTFWTDEDCEAMHFRVHAHMGHLTLAQVAAILNGPYYDDKTDADNFLEYEEIGHCHCLFCAK